MDRSTSEGESSEQHSDQVIAQYLEAVAAGSAPDRQDLLDRYPDLADTLESFFADHDRSKERAGLDEAAEPRASAEESDAPTMPPGEAIFEALTMPPAADVQSAAGHEPLPVRNSRTSGPSGKPEAPPLGTKVRYFGDYELIDEIARGGMGVVYKARQRHLNRIVAVKMILSGQFASEDDIQRFYSEAEAAANLDHPGIVPVYEVGEYEGQHYFSMGFVEGQSLAIRLAEGSFPPPQAADLTRKVADAVAYAHEHGVVHRDLKPANILLSRSGESSSTVRTSLATTSGDACCYEPRVTDFGLAKHIEIESGLTASGQALGTPSYMPPEQAAGKHAEVGPASDVYSLGAVLFELLTGRPPFQASTPVDIMIQVLEGEPPPPRSLNRAIDRNLETICLKCLNKDPQRRYSTARELADDLDRYVHGEPIIARPLGPIGRVARWARHRPALAVTLAALVAFYANHLIVLFVMKLPSEAGTFHLFVTGVVLVWVLGAMLFQRLLSRPSWEETSIYGWAAMEVVLFTGFLFGANGPSSAMAIGYLLLVAASVLRGRPMLVWLVTVLSVVGYLLLAGDAHRFRPHLAVPAYHSVYYVLSECVMGLMMYLVLRRVRSDTLNGADSMQASVNHKA